MTIREYAKKHNFKIVGKLKRIKHVYYSREHYPLYYPLYIDEDGNEYYMKDDGRNCAYIIDKEGGVI